MVPNERPLTDLVLTDNEPLNIKKMSLDGAYRYWLLTFILNMTNTGVAPTFVEDDILNYITAVGVRLNGKTFKFNVPLRLAVHKQTADYGTPFFYQAPITTVNATYDAIVQYRIDFAEIVRDESDLSALLQTDNLTNLELVISTGDKNDIASANAPTINTATVEIEIKDYTGEDPNGGNINDPTQVTKTNIIEIVEEIDLEANKTEFDKLSQDIDLVAGSNILEHALLITDNGVRSNDRVTDIKVKHTKTRVDEIEKDFQSLVRISKVEHELESIIDGFAIIDWQKRLGRTGLITGIKSDELLKLKTNGITTTQDKIQVYTKSV